MRTNSIRILIVLAGCLGLCLVRLTAADAPAKPAALPESSTVVFENDKVRIVLYQTGTGENMCGFGMHWHPAHAFIQLNDAKIKITTPDGKEEIVESKAGDTGWEPAVTHRVESLSPGNVVTYLVEYKDKDWKPSTHLQR